MVFVPSYIEIDRIVEKHIDSVKVDTQTTTIIPYKDWESKQKSLKVYEVPIEYCKYRLENGRIKTDILSHERLKGKLDPNDQDTQDIISNYLSKSDSSKNEGLKNILKKEGQKEAAVMTADGFLINGNRRKWAIEQLYKETPDQKYKTMKVVILPGTSKAERPTVMDVALLENRFQLHDTGKVEYSIMNKALTYYVNVKSGIRIEELLKEDATFGDPSSKEFKKKVEKFKEDHFKTLELMDDYLKINKIKGDYQRIADRWMSFQELSQRVTSPLSKEKTLVQYNIQKNDVGAIKNAGFNLIKLKDIRGVAPRNTDLIREIFRWIKVDKKEVLKIGNVEDVDESIKDPDERDEEWQKNKSEKILNSIKKLKNLATRQKDQEDPLNRLAEALQKLQHEDLDVNQLKTMKTRDIPKAFGYCSEIEKINKNLKSFFYNLQKNNKENIKKLKGKFKKK